MSESEGYSVQEGISGQKRKRKNSEDEKDAAELRRESSSGSDESATGEDREDKETDFFIPSAARKRKEEESDRDADEEDSSTSEATGETGTQEEQEKGKIENDGWPWSSNTRQDSLAELMFAFQRPAGLTQAPVKPFKMPQGHEMIVFVEHGQDDCTIKVEARGAEKQERNLCWPLEAKIVVLLHPQKDTQGQLMEGERCEGPGKQLCSLKVRKDNILIKSMGFVDKDGMMNITLILK